MSFIAKIFEKEIELDILKNEKMEMIRDCITCNGTGLHKAYRSQSSHKDTTFCAGCCLEEMGLQNELDKFKQKLIDGLKLFQKKF